MCDHQAAVFGVQIFRNGKPHIVRWCPSCEAQVNETPYFKSFEAAGVTRRADGVLVFRENGEEVPVVIDQREGWCKHCGDLGVEEHHYAPRYIFPDADDWGTVPLCVRCHTEWHDRINEHYAALGWEGVEIVE